MHRKRIACNLPRRDPVNRSEDKLPAGICSFNRWPLPDVHAGHADIDHNQVGLKVWRKLH